MHEPDLVGVHEARIAHHVAAVRQIDRQHRSAAVRDGAGPVIVKLFVVVGADVAAGEHVFEMLEERRVDRHHVFEVAVDRAILHHQDLAVALDDLRLDLADFLVAAGSRPAASPSRICWRISGTHLGQSESVSRGQPSFGFIFSQLFSSGLSDHFGVKDGFGLIELSLSKTNHAALAARATLFRRT